MTYTDYGISLRILSSLGIFASLAGLVWLVGWMADASALIRHVGIALTGLVAILLALNQIRSRSR